MKLLENAKGFGKKLLFQTKKYSPEILTGAAIAFGVGTVVATWFAARKTDKALEKPKAAIKAAKEAPITETYTEKDRNRDIWHWRFVGAAEMIKLYGPAALMGSFSIACVLGSYKVLSARNAGLVMANGILQKEFSDYRDKVIEKYGKEEDHNLRFGDKTNETEVTEMTEDGEVKKETVTTAKEGYEEYEFARCFDELNPLWRKDPLRNLTNLRLIRDDLNVDLRMKGALTLADVYRALKFEPTQASFTVGWIWKRGTEQTEFIDFGIPLDDSDYVNEMASIGQDSFWLEFNCKEIVWSKTPFDKDRKKGKVKVDLETGEVF